MERHSGFSSGFVPTLIDKHEDESIRLEWGTGDFGVHEPTSGKARDPASRDESLISFPAFGQPPLPLLAHLSSQWRPFVCFFSFEPKMCLFDYDSVLEPFV